MFKRALIIHIVIAAPAEGPSILPPPIAFTCISKSFISISVIFLITDAALNTESFAIDPAVSLNLTVPAPSFFAGNTVASISIVDPMNPLTPSPYTCPTSFPLFLSNISYGVKRPMDKTSSTSRFDITTFSIS